jgi:LCP family protein required for cell wall assembly
VNEELLIRQAIAAEAEQAVDPGVVLANLRRGRKLKHRRTTLVTVAGFAVAAAVVAVAVPLTVSREAAPPANSVAPAPVATDQNILLLGMDGRDSVTGSRTDAIVLARLGTDGSLRGVSLPRDTRVGTGVRLNAIYSEAFTAAQRAGNDPVAAATAKLMTTVKDITGVQPGHYAIVEMAGFGELATAVGGVEVCLNKAINDRMTHKLAFPAGPQTLSGETATTFLRNRATVGGDYDRMARQQAFLKSLIGKLPDVVGDPMRLAKVAGVVKSNVVTDPGLDLVDLARRLTKNSAVELATIPVALSPTSDGMEGIDPEQVRRFTASFLAATPVPAPSGSATAISAPSAGVPCSQ